VLIHDSEIICSLVETRKSAKPIYVSIGHMVTLKMAVEIVKRCIQNGRIPEPIRQAHKIASETRNQILLAKESNQ